MPLPLIPLLLSAAAGIGAILSEKEHCKEQRAKGKLLVSTLWTSPPGESESWKATELLTERALDSTGPIFDLDMATWWPDVNSSFYRVVVVARMGGGEEAHVALKARKQGHKWVADMLFTRSGGAANDRQEEVVNQVLKRMNYWEKRRLVSLDEVSRSPDALEEIEYEEEEDFLEENVPEGRRLEMEDEEIEEERWIEPEEDECELEPVEEAEVLQWFSDPDKAKEFATEQGGVVVYNDGEYDEQMRDELGEGGDVEEEPWLVVEDRNEYLIGVGGGLLPGGSVDPPEWLTSEGSMDDLDENELDEDELEEDEELEEIEDEEDLEDDEEDMVEEFEEASAVAELEQEVLAIPIE